MIVFTGHQDDSNTINSRRYLIATNAEMDESEKSKNENIEMKDIRAARGNPQVATQAYS